MPFKKEQSVNLMFIHQGSHHSLTVWYDSGVIVYHICATDLHVGLSGGGRIGYMFSGWLEQRPTCISVLHIYEGYHLYIIIKYSHLDF